MGDWGNGTRVVCLRGQAAGNIKGSLSPAWRLQQEGFFLETSTNHFPQLAIPRPPAAIQTATAVPAFPEILMQIFIALRSTSKSSGFRIGGTWTNPHEIARFDSSISCRAQ